jgi:hypothetical protein
LRWTHHCYYGAGISLLLAATAWAGQPSDDEQYWLQLVNRFRANPAEELDLLVNYRVPGTGVEFADPKSDSAQVRSALDFFGVNPTVLRQQFQNLKPVPPLVWNENLHESARYYSNLVIEKDQQSHELDEHTDLFDRLEEEGGYDTSGGGLAAENVFAFTYDVDYGHAGFVIDWGSTATGIQNPPGHRDNLLTVQFREIGIAIAPDDDPSTDVGPLIATQHLAVDFADGPFATGVVHQDLDSDHFYTPGEGLAGVKLELRREDGSVLAAGETYQSGGYRLDVSNARPGVYELVLMSDQAPVYWSGPVEIAAVDQNFAIDVTDPQYDIDSMSRVWREGRDWSYFDLNNDGQLTQDDRTYLIHEVYETYLGDSNLDGRFDSNDLVQVFQASEYDDDVPGNSVWSTGDWTGNGEFDSGDLVAAFQEGGYDRGPRLVRVPEPSTAIGWLVGWLIAASCWRSSLRGRRI